MKKNIALCNLKMNENDTISIVKFVTAIMIGILGVLIINTGWNWHNNTNEAMGVKCKGCSIFEKNCPYTDEELMEQEYDYSNPCSDMGFYEMSWKFSLMFIFIGVGLIAIPIPVFYKIFKRKSFV